MKKQLEKDIQRSIIEWLAWKKIFHYKNNTVGIYKQSTGSYIPSQSAGAPDIVCILRGKYIGLEVKTAKGVLSENQISFKNRVEKAGGIYAVVRSIDEVEEVLNSY